MHCLIAIDKPYGLTSHDVVSRVRRALGERRVGHAGTLDPAATGVLIVGIGQATRLLGLLTLDDKRYEARIAFGQQTTTDDAEGEVIRAVTPAAELFDPAYATRVLASLIGEFDQVPPAYSAISVGGQRAYARARDGQMPTLAPRRVCLYSAQLLSIEGDREHPVWHCAFHVSKGTYIRALARDCGCMLGSAAHLASLCRSAAGVVGLEQCVTLSELTAQGIECVRHAWLDPARALGLPVRLLEHAELSDVSCGRRISAGQILDLSITEDSLGLRVPQAGERVSLVFGQKLYGVWTERHGQLAAKVNFPEGIEGVRA